MSNVANPGFHGTYTYWEDTSREWNNYLIIVIKKYYSEVKYNKGFIMGTTLLGIAGIPFLSLEH